MCFDAAVTYGEPFPAANRDLRPSLHLSDGETLTELAEAMVGLGGQWRGTSTAAPASRPIVTALRLESRPAG